jgi:prepilin-type N-terminal cleavage/methylation domain-containing protein
MFERLREARRNGENGFTLIELLIVIVILGVLAGIVVFAVGAFQNDGKVAACKSDVKNVEIAQEAFYAKAVPQAYAASVDALVTAKYLKEAPDATEGISTGTTGVVAHTCSTT